MSASASFDDVHALLSDCAAGFSIRNTTHFLKVEFNGRTFPDLPSYKKIELGHIRKMVRTLQINKECANKHIPGLFKIEKPAPESPEKPKPPV
jgi:hypothetical protein